MNFFNGPEIDTTGDKIKICSFLAYLGPFFIVGIILDKLRTPSLKFHINQGITLFAFEILISFACWIISLIPFIGGFISNIMGVIMGAICVVFIAIGFINIMRNLQKPLPYIGDITLLK